ncbi:MAG TPA: type II glyceraldehyde-3-phosphate dehydrogenase [Candidatus Saccharimonadales bacterium]|nr:type II glyceraldehyde-3-phosphate dehydrogenase [Candidatus Saccharimonadales bacterium]
MIKVGVNGYGVIGRRVAYAVSLQDDMELSGIAKREPDYKARTAARNGFNIYSDNRDEFKARGIQLKGSVEELLSDSDIIVDCTPEGVGSENKKLYEKAGCRAIWQGGEEHELTSLSFNAYANYSNSLDARFSRVVSCNTTGLVRSLFPLTEIGIEHVNGVLIRRAADPSETKKGPINALEPDTSMPSHHAEDVRTIMPDLKIDTVAIKASTTLMHLQYLEVELARESSKDEVLKVWGKYNRLALVSSADGIKNTAHVMDYAKDMRRGGGDMYEIAIWNEIGVKGSRLSYFQAVHQESDVVPENIDAIRAMCGIEKEGSASIKKTDSSLKIGV